MLINSRNILQIIDRLIVENTSPDFVFNEIKNKEYNSHHFGLDSFTFMEKMFFRYYATPNDIKLYSNLNSDQKKSFIENKFEQIKKYELNFLPKKK